MMALGLVGLEWMQGCGEQFQQVLTVDQFSHHARYFNKASCFGCMAPSGPNSFQVIKITVLSNSWQLIGYICKHSSTTPIQYQQWQGIGGL